MTHQKRTESRFSNRERATFTHSLWTNPIRTRSKEGARRLRISFDDEIRKGFVACISIKQSMEISNPTVSLCRGLQRGDHLHRPLRVRAHGHVQESFRNQRPRTHGYHSHTDQGTLDTPFIVSMLIYVALKSSASERTSLEWW